jgi:glutamyl-tRNA synthetase
MTVVTRFAPSPTGFLHIGGARTALFNWLHARHEGGKFLLRIEDTDRERSTQAATDAIIDGMQWLGLDWDGEVIHQFARAARHAEVAHELVRNGHAYHCYATQEELDGFRKANPNAKFRSPYRDGASSGGKDKAVIRIKAPLNGKVTIHDKVQGEVTVDCEQLDDMVLLRSDGTPTYMLAVVVDDHDMGVTQIIRGDDHFTNTFRQWMIYNAMGWETPKFAHVPMIHGPDGAKLSKRHGAQGVGEYREMGYLPEAIRNYLLRLGWSHGDDEIINTEQAIKWFGLDGIGKSPSRFDFTKLENLNGHYIRESGEAKLVDLITPLIQKQHPQLASGNARLLKGMNGLKQRAKNIKELADSAAFYVSSRPIKLNDKAKALLSEEGKAVLRALLPLYEAQAEWSEAALQDVAKQYAEKHGVKLGNLAQPLRAALSGSNISPGVFDVMAVLGKGESLGRIRDVC